jgi:hypothetical protein
MQDFLNSTRRSVAWFKEVHDKGTLLLRPPFQRNPVWTDSQKSYLVDSILRGYPIPELYLQEAVDAKGREQHTVVDGQQRVRACLEFLEGRFSLRDEDSPEWADLTFDDLGEALKKKIFSYNFIVRQIPETSEEQLRIIFMRLNRSNVALTRQELRHATYWGPFIKCVERLAESEYWTTSGVFTPNDIRRMHDAEFVSELVVGFLHGPQNKKLSLDKWYEIYETSFPDEARVDTAVSAVTGELHALLPGIKDTRWRKKSDYYSLFLCFASKLEHLPLSKGSRASATKLLINFSDDVDRYISQGGSAKPTTKMYADSVERAASDLSFRKRRIDALEKLLTAVW